MQTPMQQHPRFLTSVPVTVVMFPEDDARPLRLHDISLGGMFVCTPHPPALGASVEVFLDVPEHAFRAAARVVHVIDEKTGAQKAHPVGMGLRFEALHDANAERLDAIVHRLAELFNTDDPIVLPEGPASPWPAIEVAIGRHVAPAGARPVVTPAPQRDYLTSPLSLGGLVLALLAQARREEDRRELVVARATLLRAQALLPSSPGIAMRLSRVNVLLDEQRAGELLKQADVHAETGGLERALTMTRQAWALAPLRSVKVAALRVLEKVGAEREAIALARGIVDEYPREEAAWLALMRLYRRIGDVEKAREAAEELSLLQPGERGALVRLHKLREQ